MEWIILIPILTKKALIPLIRSIDLQLEKVLKLNSFLLNKEDKIDY